jgi:hypothetical protein
MIKILLFAIVGLSISQANAQSPAQQAEALNLKAKAA